MRIRTASISTALLAASALSLFACSTEADDASGATEAHAEKENDLFVAPGVLTVRIEAPLSTLFTRLKNRQTDQAPAPDPNADPNAAPAKVKAGAYSEPGKLVFSENGVEKSIDMRVYIRGESSKTDCVFPKLKLDFTNKEQLKKTPFKGHGEVRINTHCGPGDEKSRSQLGRVTNGVGPVREELAYRLVRAMGIETYRTRVLKVRYQDTANNEPFDTFAMAMESSDDAVQRFAKMTPPLVGEGATLLDWGNKPTTPENEAHVAIAEAFVGNKDWGGSHNVDYFGAAADATNFRIPQDFDLGAIVLGDIANYWKGMAAVSEASNWLTKPGVAAKLKAHQADVEKAMDDAEKAAIDAEAIQGPVGKTIDSGFVEARKRVQQLFELPEVKNAGAAPADAPPDAGPADAGQ